ncbi:MAG: autotransporter domain-containing protein [Cellvibrionaceae bacterium]|nr:autotransporter domain-containing protein [Cellvibrionaceae bacterium]
MYRFKKIQKRLYILSGVVFGCFFCQSASANPFSVSSSTSVSQSTSIIGSTVNLDVEIDDVTGSTPNGGSITLSLDTTGTPGVNWTPDSSPCTPTATPNEFTCTVPALATANFSFITQNLNSPANYSTTIELGPSDCIAGSGTPAATCSQIESFDIVAPTLTITLAGGGNSVTEGDSGNNQIDLEFTVDQLPANSANSSYQVEIVAPFGSSGNPAATQPSDFDTLSTLPTLFWGSNSSPTQTVSIDIVGDTVSELTESIYIGSTSINNLGPTGTPPRFELIINDNDAVITPPPVVTPPEINASSQRSFSENSGQASITFSRSGDTSEALSFDFTTIDASPIIKSEASSSGIATAGTDYTSTSTTVTWAAGESSSKTVDIPILDDSVFEGDETFQAQASNLSSGASFNFDPNFTFTISENDVEPGGELNFSSATYEINEDAGTATITISRSGGTNGAISVNYASSDDTAKAGEDYNSSTGSLSWANGEGEDKSFTVTVNADIINEPTETVILTLSNPTGSATLGGQANAVLNILNVNEAGAPEISKEDISVTDFDGDGLVEVVLDATGKIVSDNPINEVNWIKDGDTIATGMTTSAKLPIGIHPLQVVATDSNGKMAAVDFIAEVKELDPETTRMLSDTSGLNTEQGSVAGALDDLCPRLSELGQQNGLTVGQSNLRNRCEQLRDPDLDDADIVEALDQIAGEEAEAIIITAARFTNMHQTNLRNRFTQLRRGGKALIDVSGLNMRLDGGSLSGNMFAAVGRNLIGGGAASGDEAEPEIYSDSRLGLFMNGNISYGERDPTKNNSGFKLDIEGITAGMDYRFTDKFIGGIAIGYSSSDLDYANDGGVLEGSSTFYSAYTSYYSDKNYYIDSSITYADSDFDVTRHIKYKDMSGLVDLRRGGSTNGEQLLATLDFGWDYNNGPWTFGPNGSFSYSDTSIDGYAEQGDSGLELQYSGQDNVTGTLGLGFHGSRVFLMDWGVLIANLNGNYYREFKNQNGVIRASFVHDPFRLDSTNPTQEMLIVSDIPDRNYFSLGLGLAAQFKYGLSGFIDYQSLLKADDIKSRELAFGLRYEAKF